MKELVDFCQRVAFTDDLDQPILGTTATRFFRQTLIPMVQKAHAAWPHANVVGLQAPVATFFQGQYFASYVPPVFRNEVITAPRVQQHGVQMTLHGHVYRIYIVSLKRRSELFFREMVYKIYLWLSLCSVFASRKCSQEMNVYLYLLPDPKRLPKPQSDRLSVENINTAFTGACDVRTEINIFREEEWFKVLIHETFHNHGFDFSENFDHDMVQDQLHRCFPALRSSVLLFESYCEVWAGYLHTMMVAFLSDNDGDVDAVWERFDDLWRIERIFSRFQCVKVLDLYGLTYDQLLRPDTTTSFEEEGTNVFAYYVVKYVLVHNGAFLDWHLKMHGPTLKFPDASVGKMCQWIYKASRQPNLVRSIRHMERVRDVPANVMKTLRMVANG
jgi:hypothetical protein